MTSAKVRKFVGKLVEVTWEDPYGAEIHSIPSAPKGRKALAKWVEWGRLDNVDEGVVRLRHGECYSPRIDYPDEALYGWIDVRLITDIRRIDK